MITKHNLESMLKAIGYSCIDKKKKIYEHKFPQFGNCHIVVDFKQGKIFYPQADGDNSGIIINRKTICNFSAPENFVVLECITKLLEKGYRPEHIELEKPWLLGHDPKGGYADIIVYEADTEFKAANKNVLTIIECKTAGQEYNKALKETKSDGKQLFSYWQQERSTKWLVIYASDFQEDENKVTHTISSICCTDDENIKTAAQKDSSVLLYANARNEIELFNTWDETYDKRFCGDVIFGADTVAYQIGVKPLRKKDLKDFGKDDGIVNKFEEILRHNNVSDKENAFNRLVALFICKLVDEIQKSDNDELEFQYKVGTDTYESLQDRLQRLHRDGMKDFMREEIFYVADDYAEKVVQQYTGQKRKKLVEDLKKHIRILKFFTNNDFAFKDVHNEELFYQNGKVLVEVVELFQNYRIIGSNNVQMIGDMFEQLLNKGFKQNEGQFFTPTPVTRFMWEALPLEKIINTDKGAVYPKVIDYACGAGHFLTEGVEVINDSAKSKNCDWVRDSIFGIEKDYRLARVSKIALFMHGAGEGNIIFGDGLENYKEKGITPESFDILVANPPYSVKGFKPHLKLKENSLAILDKITNDGSEIETLFVERVAQLLKPKGIAAVILPSSVLNKEQESFIAARETILKNFKIRAIAQMGDKTFGATGTNTVIIFLEKYDEPPKRIDLVADSVQSILEGGSLDAWEDKEIFANYLEKIGVEKNEYLKFLKREENYTAWAADKYFTRYVAAFTQSSEYINKTQQKNFASKSEEEKNKWYNEHFYNYAAKIEADKLTYFALAYKQNLLIISAPSDKKEQEKFLGYTWSNRKGQEGIHTTKLGGVLYNPQDRNDKTKIAKAVRNSFNEKYGISDELSEYCYMLPLKDMLDFSGAQFNKAVKTVRLREKKRKEGYASIKLDGKEFELSIGDRVLSTEISDNGKYPVYSANVFEEFGRIDKLNREDFSKPSVIWGIDGDWMVNVIPSGVKFYPTDHCGVLRINSENILPEYVAEALQIAGTHEGFSRSNRASIQRISALTLELPNLETQKKIISENSVVKRKIAENKNVVSKCDEEIKAKFVEMFENEDYAFAQLRYLCTIVRGVTYPKEAESYETTHNAILTADNITLNGDFEVKKTIYVSDELELDALKKLKKNDIFICLSSGSIKHVGKNALIKYDTEYFAGGFMGIFRTKTTANPVYLHYALSTKKARQYFESNVTGTNIKNLSNDIENMSIHNPPIDLQNQFAEFAEQKEQEKAEAEERIKQLEAEREKLIEKYFK